MRKLIVLAFWATAIIGGAAYAQDVPKEVRTFLDNYIKDSTARVGPIRARNVGYFDSGVQIKDLKVRAIQTYAPKRNIAIETYPDTVALSELIEPTPFWNVFIMMGNKPLYQLELSTETGTPEFVTTGLSPLPPNVSWEYIFQEWIPLFKTYPESTGINPVYFVLQFPYDYRSWAQFFYFQQKGPRKIYFAGSRGSADTLRTVFKTSIKTLDDSRKLVNVWKKLKIEQKRLEVEEQRNVTEFRRRHGLEDEKKHTEYIECYNKQPRRYGSGNINYYGDENEDSYIKLCLEEVKTGIRKVRKIEPQYGQNGFFINTNALQENQKVHEELKKARAQ